jgi:Protein of unknown function (DUF3570)
VPPVQKAVVAGVVKQIILFFTFFLLLYSITFAQLLPSNETQVNFSGYFDNFNVSVIYPSISITKRLSESSSITARYLVDMITAASIRNGAPNKTSTTNNSILAKVDAVTAASGRTSGGGSGDGFSESILPTFDEVRHEFNLGFAHLFGNGLFTADGIYSTESDYTSSTLIGNYTQYLAENNTSVQLGIVRSWDKVFPKTVNWKKDKNVTTFNANFSQVISKSLILQLLSSYTNNNGILSDNYQLVPITINGTDSLFQPIHPDLRIRRAAALSLKYRLSSQSSLQLGYRYYWDSWNIFANTYSANYERYLSKHVILGIGWRGNFQTRAFFFKPTYLEPEQYMTSDIKLEAGNSNEVQLSLVLTGGDRQEYLPFLKDERVQYILNLNFYARHTDSPYWYNNKSNLFATDFNIGIRYRY